MSKSWHAIAQGDLLTPAGLAAQAVTVENLDDDTLARLAAKRAAWATAETEAQRSTFARLADTYVAAFLAPKLAGSRETVPLSGYLWNVLNGQGTKAEIENAAQAMCRLHGVFHWWLAFPQVAARGGFDVMLGNPPWERIKLQEEEFFATRSPLVAAARNKSERAQRIEWLREGMLLHRVNPDLERMEGLTPPNRAEIALYTGFIAARRGAEAASLYAHHGGRFLLTGVGDVNTYALFAETFLQGTASSGRAGFIVPTGIATDDSTKSYFEAVAQHRRLAALYSFENEEFVFPAVHHAMKFALVTTTGEKGVKGGAQLVHFARQVEYIYDPRRRFTLTPDEFFLINPNTRTCPVFRSERDAELTKKLCRNAPVLVKEVVTDESGETLRSEVNPWRVSFQRMFDMSNDSGLFADSPAATDHPSRLPLYEAKMIHQFDHRWATYVDVPSEETGEVETKSVGEAQKCDSDFTVRPRYWVDEREVLARIANVPSRVSRAWLSLHSMESNIRQDAVHTALADLLFALSQWVVGELFHRAAGEPPAPTGWTPMQAQPHIPHTDAHFKKHFPRLSEALRATGLTIKKSISEFAKWAIQITDMRLSNDELENLAIALNADDNAGALLILIDRWMDQRAPRWMIGFRGITNATNERSFIVTVLPSFAVGNSIPLLRTSNTASACAALVGNLSALTLDFVARQKIGGTNLNFFIVKQFPVLPPNCYSPSDFAFIVPRVLELTYTSHDLRYWADELSAFDPRPDNEQGKPFMWNTTRRAQLRAELDAYYARLYGLTRDELRYILDPVDVMGLDYPSETFRVLKESELRTYGEYRTQRLVLEAWDRLDSID